MTKQSKRKLQAFYSIRDISDMLGCDYKVIYKKVTLGEIPHSRFGRKLIRIAVSDFQSWLRSKEVHSD